MRLWRTIGRSRSGSVVGWGGGEGVGRCQGGRGRTQRSGTSLGWSGVLYPRRVDGTRPEREVRILTRKE